MGSRTMWIVETEKLDSAGATRQLLVFRVLLFVEVALSAEEIGSCLETLGDHVGVRIVIERVGFHKEDPSSCHDPEVGVRLRLLGVRLHTKVTEYGQPPHRLSVRCYACLHAPSGASERLWR